MKTPRNGAHGRLDFSDVMRVFCHSLSWPSAGLSRCEAMRLVEDNSISHRNARVVIQFLSTRSKIALTLSRGLGRGCPKARLPGITILISVP